VVERSPSPSWWVAPAPVGAADRDVETSTDVEPGMRKRWDLILLVMAVVVTAVIWWQWPKASASDQVRVAAVGDMACSSNDPRYANGAGAQGWCAQQAVSSLVAGKPLDAMLGLGDYQYEEARSNDYQKVYGPSWGRLRSITRPAIGNQEYKVHDANTFTGYFGGVDATKGWYSYDLGKWHIVVLNSNCPIVGGCDTNSPQLQWLRADLAANKSSCVLAYWHHPRWSTGLWGNDDRTDAFWQTLANGGADVVLTAHEHDYERFVPLGADGRPNPKGIRSFVVGTGGQAVYGPDGSTANRGTPLAANRGSAVRIDDHYGALFLTLGAGSYHWNFTGLDGRSLDEGDGSCTP
jgi:hypothetical protein